MTDICTIIIHIGYKDYLKWNLVITGKNNKIYLIGDKSVKHLGNMHNVTFINIDKYINDKLILNYKKHFINYKSNDATYEWICFCRVFIIKLFLEEYKLKNIFHIDSDNVLLKNINEYNFSKENAYNIVQNWHPNRMSNSIHNGLLTLNFCNKFEELYNDIYVTKEKLHLIQDKINYHKSNPGGICDMTLYYLLQYHNYIEVDNLCKSKLINNKKTVFMHILSAAEGSDSKDQYRINNGNIDIIKDKNGKSNLIYDKINNEYVDIFNIHFQGESKRFLNNNLLKNINF